MNKTKASAVIIVWLVLFVFQLPSLSQENFPVGSRSASLANTYVMESDIWSVFHNQAGLGFYNDLSIGFHHENKFLVKEYSLHSLALTLPVKPGTFGVNYTYFGFMEYNESKIGLGFGKAFGEKFSAGVQINLHHIFILGDYGNRNSLTVEGGIQYRPVKDLHFGIHLFNPSRSKISPHDLDTIPTIIRTGISYKPVQKVWLGFETMKSLDHELRLRAGIQYQLIRSLYLRTGIETNPVRNTFGIGYGINRISADIAFTHHQVLGFTPHFAMQFIIRPSTVPD